MRELRAEIGDAPVVLLSTSTCGYCKRLRADLRRVGRRLSMISTSNRIAQDERAYVKSMDAACRSS